MIEPNRVLDDRHRKTVAVGFRVTQGRLAYPDPVKATQPLQEHLSWREALEMAILRPVVYLAWSTTSWEAASG